MKNVWIYDEYSFRWYLDHMIIPFLAMAIWVGFLIWFHVTPMYDRKKK